MHNRRQLAHAGRRDGTLLTGLFVAPFRIVAPFGVCSPAAVRETVERGRRSRTEFGSKEIETKTRDKGKQGEKSKESINAIRANEGKADRPHRRAVAALRP